MAMGNPILSNIIMIGAAAGTGLLPLDREDFESVISSMLAPDKLEINLSAYDFGQQMVVG
jgi:indolepyruvate ferredoxin oxidoreductase beta subunit